MVAFGHQRGAGQPAAGAATDRSGAPVAREAEPPGERQRAQAVHWPRLEQTLRCLVAGNTGADEDRGHHRKPGDALGALAPQREGDAERDRGQRVARVVDQVGEQRDRAREDEDQRLGSGGEREHEQCQGDRAQPGARARD
jgi:hypothetical protein